MISSRSTLAVLAMLTTAPFPVAAQQDFGFDIKVTLSDKAAATLAAKHEGIKAFASYSGYPLDKADRHINEVGLISVSPKAEWVDIPPTGGIAYISGRTIDPDTLKRIEGEVMVNVNITSARKSSSDNILECDIIDGSVQDVRVVTPITVHCSLISEHPSTQALPEAAP